MPGRLTFRRLVGLDRSGGPPPETRRGEALHPLTIPNAIGVARILLIPVFLVLALESGDGRDTAATILFAFIAASDWLDGMAARITGQYSRLGALLDPLTVVATTVMWGGVAVLTLGLVWQLMGGALLDRRFLAVLASAVLAAGLLSCAGIDHRRWWALATVGALAALVLLTPPSGAGAGPGRRRAFLLVPAAALLVAGGWAMQLFPVFSLQV